MKANKIISHTFRGNHLPPNTINDAITPPRFFWGERDGFTQANIYCTSDTLKIPKFRFLLLLWSVNSFAMSRRESLSILSLWLFEIIRLLIVLYRSHVVNLRAVKYVLSPAVLVAGITSMILHSVMTLFIVFRSGVSNSLISTMMSSKHKKSPSYSITFKISI